MLPNNKNVFSSKCYGCSEFPLKLLFSIAYLTETTPKQFVAKSLLGCKIVLDTPDSTSTILNKRFNSNWKIFRHCSVGFGAKQCLLALSFYPFGQDQSKLVKGIAWLCWPENRSNNMRSHFRT